MVDLLPCPFCGEDVSVDDSHAPTCYFTLVRDMREEERGDLSTIPMILDAWNTRKDPMKAVAWAVYGHSDEYGQVLLPAYCGSMEVIKNRVMEAARRERFSGNFFERLADLDWLVEPLFRPAMMFHPTNQSEISRKSVVEPGRYFASGPQGSFFTDNLQLARDLVNAYDKQDDWTITDLQNPIDAARAGERG